VKVGGLVGARQTQQIQVAQLARLLDQPVDPKPPDPRIEVGHRVADRVDPPALRGEQRTDAAGQDRVEQS